MMFIRLRKFRRDPRDMTHLKESLALITLLTLLTTGLKAQRLPPALQRAIEYEKEIQPLLEKRCHGCHGKKKQKGDLRLDLLSSMLRGGESGEPALVPGKSAESHLVKLVSGLDPELVMPPRGKRLSAGEIGLLRAWIDQGANIPGQQAKTKAVESSHWAFRPVVKTEPEKKTGDWGRNPVDGFILAGLQAGGVSPSPQAGRVNLIRRLRYVMHGLPPTPGEIKTFVEDRRKDSWKMLVEAALESERYGERWARHWLDIIRFGESHGFETNRERPNAWHYRDYVIRSFNEDKPYNDFVREQIAGDALGNGVATGFLVAGPHDIVKSPDINLTLMQRQDELADLINVTGTTFLGLTLGCARCHNHKFDPISQRDYYSIQAVFAGVQHEERTITTGKKDPAPLDREIAELKNRLSDSVLPSNEKILLLDDELSFDDLARGVTHLARPRGKSPRSDGTARGEANDPGTAERPGNISGGHYTWWDNEEGKDVAAWHPVLKGRYRIWLSWGSGFKTHSKDAHYLLDHDGNPETRDDQEPLAHVDQRKFSDGAGTIPEKPLWSGLFDAGVHQLEPASMVLLRGGKEGTAITADLVIFELPGGNDAATRKPVFRPPVNSRRNIDTFEPTEARFIRFTIEATNSSQPCIDELEVFSGGRNLALASLGTRSSCSSSLPGYAIHKLEHINDGKYGNSHSWISNETGKGWGQLELAAPALIDRIEWARDREGKFGDRVATGYRIEVGLLEPRLQPVASSRTRARGAHLKASQPRFAFRKETGKEILASLKKAVASRKLLAAGNTVKVYAGTFRQPGATYRLYRGDPLQKREELPAGAVEALNGFQLRNNTPEQQRRLEFARWLSTKKNPLTARVIVNRIWMHHFGRGLVNTPNDFGLNGSEPSHPRLLDWLASELMENDWSLKHIHRLILLSETFQQESAPRKAALAADSSTTMLWRFPPRRLEAEAIRDSILQISGVLDLSMGGPGFSGFEVQMENVRHFFPKKTYGPEDWRRMIYMTKVRQEQESVFGAFDCPDASQVISRRSRSTTPIQALNLFNSSFILQQSGLLEKRLLSEAGPDTASRIHFAFELCFGRAPETGEISESEELIVKHGLRIFCRALLNSNELIFIP